MSVLSTMTQQLHCLEMFLLSRRFVTFHGISDFSKVILEFVEKILQARLNGTSFQLNVFHYPY